MYIHIYIQREMYYYIICLSIYHRSLCIHLSTYCVRCTADEDAEGVALVVVSPHLLRFRATSSP